MRSANEDLAYRAYQRLQADDIEGFLAFVDEDAQWHSLFTEMEGVYRGHEGVRRWWRTLNSVFPDWSAEVVDVRDVGDVVIVKARASGSGASSGIGIEPHFWQVVELNDGKITHYRAARTEAAAMEIAANWGASPS